MVSGLYVGLDSATLTTMLADAQACRTAILKAHQSYSQSGRSINRASLGDVTRDIAELQFALGMESGTLVRETHADLSHGP